jgi:RHS repeat-associated protein
MGDGVNAATAYDVNGNILAMQQKGLLLNSSTHIDQLKYTYETNSNKLKQVTDTANDNSSKLGDFKYDAAAKTATDYGYDANGNFISDANKKISKFSYNILNLPESISVAGKGIVTYTYDATGSKLKRVTIDSTVSPVKTTTTLYLGNGVYQNDSLQLMGMEEGRIRLSSVNGQTPSFAYDYMLKDHLGNVRMILTEEQQRDNYPAASMETAQAATEDSIYANLSTTRADKPIGYPTDTYTDPNNKVAKVRGDGNKIGPSIVLKVMAGDTFNIRASSWYKTYGSSPGTSVNPLPDLLSALTSSVGGVTQMHGGVTALQLQSSGIFTPGATQFLNSQTPDLNKPKAYLNWILFDEQFKMVSSSSGAEQVGDNEEFKTHTKAGLPVNKSGYLYIYVSNETPNIDVFFDNLQVTHIRGAILEETHYYPFGLTMAGISSKALNSAPENRYKFNSGTELNSSFDINLYETVFRSYDAQIGRFHQIDPLSETSDNWSPYAFVQNNPLLYSDPMGLDTTINGIHLTTSEQKYNVTFKSKERRYGVYDNGGPFAGMGEYDPSKDPFYLSWNREIFGASLLLSWDATVRVNNYINPMAETLRQFKAGQISANSASMRRYFFEMDARSKLTPLGRKFSQFLKSDALAYEQTANFLNTADAAQDASKIFKLRPLS